MILGGACYLFHTVQFLRDVSVWCSFSFSHRTASTRWFCVVLVLFFTPYSFYPMILCGAWSLFHTVQLLPNDSVWCSFSFSHRTASTRWFCVVLGLFFTPYSFYPMFLCGARSLFHTVQLLRDVSVRCLVSFSHRTASTHNQKFLREYPWLFAWLHEKLSAVIR